MPEILTSSLLPLLVLLVFKFLDGQDRRAVKYLVVAAFLAAVLTLTKTAFFCFPTLLVLMIAPVVGCTKNLSTKKLLASSALIVGVTALFVAPWFVRNYLIWNSFVYAPKEYFVVPN